MKMRIFVVLMMSLFFALLAKALPAQPTHPQGAIWALRESGFTDEAQDLENKIIHLMQTAELKSIANVGDGVAKAVLVDLGSNIFAVLKKTDPVKQYVDTPAKEVALFNVDRGLNLNMVSVTTLRVIKGETHSMQLYVPTWDNQKYTTGARTELDGVRRGDVRALDLAFGNVDRDVETLHNIVRSVEGRTVLIDHARTGSTLVRMYQPEPLPVSHDFAQKFSKLTAEQVTAYSAGAYTDEEIAAIQKRVGLVQQRMVPQDDIYLSTDHRARHEILIPETFIRPPELKKKTFIDMYAVQEVLGRNSAQYPPDYIRKTILENPYWRSLNLAIEFWDHYPRVTRETLLPDIIGSGDFMRDHTWFVEKIVLSEPSFLKIFVENPEALKQSAAALSRMALKVPPSFVGKKVRHGLITHFINRYKETRMGQNLKSLFPGPLTDMKKAFLRETYEALKAQNLQHQVIEVLSLHTENTLLLPRQIVASYPPEQQARVRNEIYGFILENLKSRQSRTSPSAQQYFRELLTEIRNLKSPVAVTCEQALP